MMCTKKCTGLGKNIVFRKKKKEHRDMHTSSGITLYTINGLCSVWKCNKWRGLQWIQDASIKICGSTYEDLVRLVYYDVLSFPSVKHF